MKCLFLDLASHDALVALVTEHGALSVETVHARVSDAELIPLVKKVLQKEGWAYDDIDRVACVVGPGGFTSLRVGVTFANVLSDQLDIPVAGIHLSELYGARVEREKRKEESVYWLHSTKKDQLFICGGAYTEPTLITTDELSTLHSTLSTFPWVGELIDEHRALVSGDPEQLASLVEILPGYLSALRYEKTLLEPWYGRGW